MNRYKGQGEFMKLKAKGEWIRNTYCVKNVFPFVQGVLYYTAVRDSQQLGGPPSVRFIHALDARALVLQKEGSKIFFYEMTMSSSQSAMHLWKTASFIRCIAGWRGHFSHFTC